MIFLIATNSFQRLIVTFFAQFSYQSILDRLSSQTAHSTTGETFRIATIVGASLDPNYIICGLASPILCVMNNCLHRGFYFGTSRFGTLSLLLALIRAA